MKFPILMNLRCSTRRSCGGAARHGRPAFWAATLAVFATSAGAEGLFATTQLLDVRQRSARSEEVRQVSRGGYELVSGERVDFREWYRSEWSDVEVDFLTPLTPNLGLIWGLNTGERGEKYQISPGLKIGFAYSFQPTPTSSLGVTATTRLGSTLSEDLCTADYGAIAGVVPVNCRLAASMLPPEETLKHAMKSNGLSDTRIDVRYELFF